MSGKWEYVAVFQKVGGDICEEVFNLPEELESYLKTCGKQVLYTSQRWSDDTPHKETTLF